MTRNVSVQVEEAQRNLETARRALREAQHAERQATRRFADGKITYADLRDAIRATALAEQRVDSMKAIELNIRHVYRGKHR